MVDKCKDCGKNIKGTKWEAGGYCEECLQKGRPSKGILGTFTRGLKKVSGSLAKIGRKEEPSPTSPGVRPTPKKREGRIWAKTKLTKCPKCGGEFDADHYKGKCPYCEAKKSEPTPFQLLKEKVVAQKATAEEYKQYKELKEMMEESKELREETGKVGLKGGILGRLGLTPGKARKEVKQKITGMPKNIALKGFDKFLGAAGTVKKTGKNALLFGIYFPLTILSFTMMLIPSVDPFYMAATGSPINIPGLAWLISQTWSIILIIFALMFGVILPPSLILGKQGVDFGGLNAVLLSITAISAGAWGTTNIFLPAFQTFMPGEYAMMMCLIKYKGNMQICIAPGNQTVQYEKVGTYETITSELGAVTPSKSIPPMNPVPGMWDSYPYTLPFTLNNNNQVGSQYEIAVKEITVYASSQANAYNESEGDVNPDNLVLSPGGYYVVSARFDENSEIIKSTEGTGCEQYTYFQINVTTEQIGGGSTKFGIIQNDEGIDNQNFMYFFDPDVKTEPGPLDIYTYTLPFVIPMNRVGGTDGWQTQGDPGFMIFIHITNQGDGFAKINSLKLIQTTDKISLSHFTDTPCGCMGFVYSGENVTQVDASTCSSNNISFNSFSIPSDGSAMITCKGWFDDTTFIGKSTQFISVDAEYLYKQTFEEQIACYKMSTGQVAARCSGFTSDGQETCEDEGCIWCEECYEKATITGEPRCVANRDECGYYCDDTNDECKAECTLIEGGVGEGGCGAGNVCSYCDCIALEFVY